MSPSWDTHHINVVLKSSSLIFYVANSTTQHFAIAQGRSWYVLLPYWPPQNGSLLNKTQCITSLSMVPTAYSKAHTDT